MTVHIDPRGPVAIGLCLGRGEDPIANESGEAIRIEIGLPIRAVAGSLVGSDGPS